MTIYVLTNSVNESIVYPATPYHLREQHRNVSFPDGFTFEDLSSEERHAFGLRPLTVVAAPTFDPATQTRSELVPYLNEGAGEWTQQWSVTNMTPEEVAAFAQSQLPPPDFASFQIAALTSTPFRSLVAAAVANDPLTILPATSLATLLTQVAAGQPPDALIAAFGQVIEAAAPSNAVLNGFIATAQTYHLPEALIDALLRVHLSE